MHLAAESGRVDMLDYLWTEHRQLCNIDAPSANQWTPLFTAVNIGIPRIVEWFLNKHANLNHEDSDGNLCSYYAVSPYLKRDVLR